MVELYQHLSDNASSNCGLLLLRLLNEHFEPVHHQRFLDRTKTNKDIFQNYNIRLCFQIRLLFRLAILQVNFVLVFDATSAFELYAFRFASHCNRADDYSTLQNLLLKTRQNKE
jgi:hypothetical protein